MNLATIQAWLASKNLTTKTFGTFLIFFIFAYNGSQTLRDSIGVLFVGHQVVVTKLGQLCATAALLIGLWRGVSHSSSPAGTVANAEAILQSSTPPTRVEINAAQTATK